ncbi:MAG: pilus assembly protein PilM [Planctomycetaceae bacterium]|nr:pilus assembly protein PilM [Planctomycetaceae bacterium]
MSRQLPIGLHLDGDTVVLAQLAMQGDRPVLHAAAAGELPADVSDITARAAALKRLLLDHHFVGRSVVSCLPSRDLTIQNLRLPQVPEGELPPLLRWEAQERLPYPIDEAELRHLSGGVILEDGVTKQETILLAARRDAIGQHLNWLDAAGLTPLAIDLAGCGMLRCLMAADDGANVESVRRAYIHMGVGAVTALVATGGHVMFLKHLPCGGRSLDQTLARATGLSEEEAIVMRRTVVQAASLDADDDLHRTVIEAIRLPLEGLATDLELCLRHVKVTFRGAAPDSFVVTGPDASPWLAEFFADRLHLPATLFQPFQAFGRAGNEPECPARFTVAAGLSLRGATGTRAVEVAAMSA